MRKSQRAAIATLCLFAVLHSALAAQAPVTPASPGNARPHQSGLAAAARQRTSASRCSEMLPRLHRGHLDGCDRDLYRLSADELESVVTAVDWRDILQSAPRQSFPVNRKSRDLVFPLGLEVGVKKDGLVLPGGLIPTHQIEALFRRIVGDAGPISNFNQLPIPFRAVATDIESGQMRC